MKLESVSPGCYRPIMNITGLVSSCSLTVNS